MPTLAQMSDGVSESARAMDVNAPPLPTGGATSSVREWPATRAVLVTRAGGAGVFVTGDVQMPNTGRDFLTVRYDALTGQRLWAKTFNGSGTSNDIPGRTAVSADGSKVFVSGTSNASDIMAATVAYDAHTGDRLWARHYAGPFGRALPGGLTVSPNGSKLYFTGASLSAGGYFVWATVAYDAADGSSLWVRHYVGPATGGSAGNAVVSHDGSRIFVTGSDNGTNGWSNGVTVAYRASNGKRVWVRRYVGLGGPSAMSGPTLSPDGNTLYVDGVTMPPPTEAFTPPSTGVAIAYQTANGQQRWKRRDAGVVATSPDGSRVFGTGAEAIDISSSEWTTIALAP